MPNVMGQEFPYTPEGMAAAKQYEQSIGMMGGGSMGFRPLGYENGGPVGSSRAAVIEYIMSMTGMQDPTVLLEMSDDQLVNAQQKIMQDGQQMQQMQQMQDPRPSIPDFPGVVPNETGGYEYFPPNFQYPSGSAGGMSGSAVPPEAGDQMIIQNRMSNGGLMSLRRR